MVCFSGFCITRLLFSQTHLKIRLLISQGHSPYGRACNVQCATAHPPAQHYTSPRAGESTFLLDSGKHRARWTVAPTSDCPPCSRCRLRFGRRMCRSCASPSPCTSAEIRGGGESAKWTALKFAQNTLGRSSENPSGPKYVSFLFLSKKFDWNVTWWSNTSFGPPSEDVSSLSSIHVLASMS